MSYYIIPNIIYIILRTIKQGLLILIMHWWFLNFKLFFMSIPGIITTISLRYFTCGLPKPFESYPGLLAGLIICGVKHIP